MKRTLAAVLAVLVLLAPMAASPSGAQAQKATPPLEMQAQVQGGLVNVVLIDDVTLDETNVCILCNVGAAVQAIVQACDTIDVNQAQVLVLQAVAANVPVQHSECDQGADQTLTITQANEQVGGGGGSGASGQDRGPVQGGLVNVVLIDDVTLEETNVCVGCNVGVAVQAIVQACDTIDVNQAQVLVAQVFTANVPVQHSECDQGADQTLTLEQASEQRGNGNGKPQG